MNEFQQDKRFHRNLITETQRVNTEIAEVRRNKNYRPNVAKQQLERDRFALKNTVRYLENLDQVKPVIPDSPYSDPDNVFKRHQIEDNKRKEIEDFIQNSVIEDVLDKEQEQEIK